MDVGLKQRLKEGLSVEEALENLDIIANIKVDEKTPVGILKEKRITTDPEELEYKEIVWLYPEDPVDFIEHIKPSYRTLLEYLKYLETQDVDWEDQNFVKSIENMMETAQDAMSKINEYFSLFHKEVSFHKEPEYLELQRFYVENILNKIISKETMWQEDAKRDPSLDILEWDQSGIKNFNAVLADQEYELFQLKDPMDHSIFSHDLLRDLKVYGKFEDEFEKKEDLFLQIKELRSRDMQASSQQILKILKEDMIKFYKARFGLKKNILTASINKAFMALMLAANFRNIKKIKSSFAYFRDFQYFLREIFSKEKSEESGFFKKLIQKIYFALFQRIGGIKQEVIGLIHRMAKGKEETSFSVDLLRKDEKIREYLKKYPNGPVRKILEVLEMEEENLLGFDPIFEGNIPSLLYEMKYKTRNISFYHIPSPTKQNSLDKASIIPEFLGFLEFGKKHILFNLQDRNSLREHARAEVLEEIPKMAEFQSKLKVISLDKNSSFYHQNKLFEKIDLFKEFKSEMKHQINSNLFYFPENFVHEEIIEKMMSFIHKNFFLEKKELSKEERLDFIEIFYHLIIFRVLDFEKPFSVSFTDKDGLDQAALLNASFYYFIKMAEKKPFSKEEKDFILWLIYSKSLMIRQRAVDREKFLRTLSMFSRIEKNRKNLQNHFLEIFPFSVEVSDNFSL